VLALAAMNGPDGGARPTGSPTTTPSQSQRRDGTGAANGSQRRDNSGVGDSRSDDPSDDEPDVGEP
jgi:hypothetical protein